MDNKKNMEAKAAEYLENVLSNNIVALREYFEKHRQEILEDFVLHINALCAITKWQQKKKVKKPIAYIHIGYLRSSFLTESYDFRLSMFSDKFWLDQIETAVYWKLDFAFMHVKPDIKELGGLLRKGRSVPEYKLQEIQYKYTLLYLPTAYEAINDLISEAVRKSDIMHLEMAKDYFVMFGGYMEESEIIYPTDRVMEGAGAV